MTVRHPSEHASHQVPQNMWSEEVVASGDTDAKAHGGKRRLPRSTASNIPGRWRHRRARSRRWRASCRAPPGAPHDHLLAVIPPGDDLGRHVIGTAHQPGHRPPVPKPLSGAEVPELERARGGVKEEVVRLDFPVSDAATVARGEREGELGRHPAVTEVDDEVYGVGVLECGVEFDQGGAETSRCTLGSC